MISISILSTSSCETEERDAYLRYANSAAPASERR